MEIEREVQIVNGHEVKIYNTEEVVIDLNAKYLAASGGKVYFTRKELERMIEMIDRDIEDRAFMY